ncbi:MAG: futalosine hydrolase [Planctomycetes bacterium]|nr:futalosine hydrolase [Planctomycetota bacterium]
MSATHYGGVPIGRFLIATATAEEWVSLGAPALVLGVGKVAAATTLYAHLVAQAAERPVAGVLLYGVAGAYPERHRRTAPPVGPGGLCVVTSDQLADEGVDTPDGFVDLGAPAFGRSLPLVDTGPFPANPRMAADAAARLGVPLVRGATVSTCSGTDARSQQLHERTRADVETMEGAAIAAVCRRCEVPLLHVRAISNWTGDRGRGAWNLGAAIDALRVGIARLCS